MIPALLALLLSVGAPTGPEPLSPAAFRDRYAAAASAATHLPAAPVDERTFRAKRTDGTELTVSIDNAYAQYLADPAAMDAIIARFVRVFAVAPAGDAPIERLVVIVRPSDYLKASLAAGASTANFVAAHAMAGDLSYFLAVDGEETIRLAGRDDLERWKVSEAEAWRRATANAKARVGSLQPIRLDDENGASGFGAESGLAPSILADPAFCGSTSKNLKGWLVLVYARDAFLYAVPTDTAMTTSFWATATREIAARRSMSDTVLACRDGRWETAAVPKR